LRGIRLNSLSRFARERVGRRRFEILYDPADFAGCWHETVDIVVDSAHFHVQKGLAMARMPYIARAVDSGLGDGSPTEIKLHIPNSTAKSFESLLGIMVGGAAYYKHWWHENDWDEALELLVTADFLGCEELVKSLENLLVHEFRYDRGFGRACQILQRLESGFPYLPSLLHACLWSASQQILAQLCRQSNSIHLEELLLHHTVTNFKTLQDMVRSHVTTLSPLLGLSDIGDECGDALSLCPSAEQESLTGPTGATQRQRSLDAMRSRLTQAVEQAARAEAEVARLKAQLLLAPKPAADAGGHAEVGAHSGLTPARSSLHQDSVAPPRTERTTRLPFRASHWRGAPTWTLRVPLCCLRRSSMCQKPTH